MADLNIVNVSDIKGRSTAANLSSTTIDVLENTAGNSKTFKLNFISVVSLEPSNTIQANVSFFDSSLGASYPLIYDLDVPIKSSIEVLSKAFYLEEGDKITSNINGVANTAVIVISYEELG